MTTETNTPATPAVEPVAVEVKAPAETAPIAVTVADEPKAVSAPKLRTKRVRAKTKTKPVRQAAEPATGTERNETMNYDPTTFFTAFPAVQSFEKLFAEATGRGEEAVKRSRKAAEEFADITRANIDAFVEAGRIATGGAQSIGQQVLAKGRNSVDQAANTVRSLAEAKTPADVLQVQSDYVRSAFDQLVEESSTLTESLVKLAGEVFEPISTRASLNVERLNEIVA